MGLYEDSDLYGEWASDKKDASSMVTAGAIAKTTDGEQPRI